MKVFALKIAAAAVRVIAAIAGLFAGSRDGIVLISCQDDKPSRDILDLAEALQASPGNLQVTVLAGRMRRSLGGAFLFTGKLFSMLRHIRGARVVAVDAYCLAVSIPKKRPGQKVVQLWHAPEAIKKFSLQVLDTPAGYDRRTADILCMHRGYDYILCQADATHPFFEEAFGYPEEVFVKLGLPLLDRIGLMKRPAPGEEESAGRLAARAAIYERYTMLNNKSEGKPLTVVYAPTFRDGESVDAAGLVRSLEAAGAALEESPGLALVLKLHPLDAQSITDETIPVIASEAKQSNDDGVNTTSGVIVIKDEEFPLIDWYAAADVIITDYSGVAVEAAAAGVASYYYIYDIDDYAARRGLNVDLRMEAIGMYAITDADALAAQIVSDFLNTGTQTQPIYDYDALAVFAGKYLEAPLTGNTEKLAAFIAGL